MPTIVRINPLELKVIEDSKDILNILSLPLGTKILAVERDPRTFGYLVSVEYPFGWCLERVIGPGLRGDIVGADDGFEDPEIEAFTEDGEDVVFYDASAERRRADQLGINCRWLIEQIDLIHMALCPGEIGTWQDRARQAVRAAKRRGQNGARH